MATVLARGQITIIDLNDARVLQCHLDSNGADNQLYEPSTGNYSPNYTTEGKALVITPKIYITGDSGVKNANCKDFKWTIDGSALKAGKGTVVLDSTHLSDSDIGASMAYNATTNKQNNGTLTIAKNIITDSLLLKFECKFVDSNGAETTLANQKTIIKTSAASALFQCLITTPDGDTFDDGIATTATLRLVCNAYHGATPCESKSTTYTWYQLNTTGTGDLWKLLSGKADSTISVARDEVLNFQTYKVVVTDGEDPNKTCEAIKTLEDRTDELRIDIACPTGKEIHNGQGTTHLYARIYRGVSLVESEASSTLNYDYTWTKFNKNGEPVAFGDGSTTKSGNHLQVSASEIDDKATFYVEISPKTT